MALTANEKVYITEKYVKWKYATFRYWEHLPTVIPDEPATSQYVEASHQKPALVLIHGYGAMIEHWRRTFAGLKNRYRIYALDLVGFGYSDKPNGRQFNYSAQMWAQQVHDFVKHKGEQKVILVGHSMGGMVSVQTQQSYPQIVAGLVLVDAAGLPDQGQAEQEGYHKNSIRINWGDLTYNAIKTPGLGEALASIFTLPNGWATRKFLEGAYFNKSKVTPQLIEQFTDPLRQAGASGSYLAVTRAFADFQLPIKPGDVAGPVLLVWGEYDKMMPPDNFVPRWTKLIPQAEIYRVPDTAHCPMDERPDLFNPRLIQFVEQIAAKPALTNL